MSLEAKEEQRDKLKMESRKKRQAESDEQKQINNEKKDLRHRKNGRQSLMSKNKFTMKKKTCNKDKTEGRV
jgi:hypothetical protein